MTIEAVPHATYEAAIGRLEAWLARAYKRPPKEKAAGAAALKKELQAIERAAKELADRVEFGPAAFELDDAAGRVPDARAVLAGLRSLANAAGEARAAVLDPRRLPQAELAALVFLHLRKKYGKPMPTQYAENPVVAEFAELLTRASGAERGTDRALTLLKGALAGFNSAEGLELVAYFD